MMTNSQLATASLDDIVFDGRNRVYGAYQLRGLYQRHVTRALIIATAMFLLLLAMPLVAQLLRGKNPEVFIKKVYIQPIDVNTHVDPPVVTPPPPATAPKPPTTPPQLPTIRNVVPVVVKEKVDTKDDEVPDHKELLERESGVRTLEGDPDAGVVDLDGLKPGKGESAVVDIAPAAPYTFVEQMPQLPGGGGTAAIVAAIQKAVRYPSLALRNGVEGRVFVSFVVNPKGEVTDVKIVKGLGSGLDEETMRAIKTLPKFIPGKQNGREVSVAFTVPVTYKIQ
jgi:protein TonB